MTVLQLPWSGHVALRELAIQTVNASMHCRYAFDTKKAAAVAVGLTEEQQLSLFQSGYHSDFNDEQRLVIAYAREAINGKISAELISKVRLSWGERGLVELTSLIGLFTHWAMIIIATISRE